VCVFCFPFSLFCFVYPPLFLFAFLEFIIGVCGLRWTCCGGIVAYYIECTNVVKKWYGSDRVNQGYQGRRGWFLKLGTPIRREPIGGSEREEESTISKICTRPGPPPPSLTRTSVVPPPLVNQARVVCLTPPPPVAQARAVSSHFLSFFLSMVWKTQANHWTKRMVSTRLTT